jgi:steroid delta-isomerase-like uncharacterized protein
MTEERIDRLLAGWEAAWSSKDPDAFAPLCDPEDVHYEDPLTPTPLESPAAIGAHARKLWTAFPDARVESTGARLTDGEHVAAPMKLVATHRGDLGGLSPTGRFVVVHGVAYCRLRDDRLHRVRMFFDVWDAAVELGVLPKPGGVGERALFLLRGFGLRRE